MEQILDYLEKHLDEKKIERAVRHQVDSIEMKPMHRAPILIGFPHKLPFKGFRYSETYGSMEAMLTNELLGTLSSTMIEDARLPMLRANYGVGTLPMFFDMPSRLVGDQMPWVPHLEDVGKVKALIAKGVPDIKNTLGRRVFETYEFYREKLSAYPNCKKNIRFYHPDLQGPFDTSHLIFGSDIYYYMVDEPELVHELLSVVTDTYIAVMDAYKKDIGNESYSYAENYIAHWGYLYAGNVALRNDTAVNLSRDMYLEFVKPYDEKILAHFKGGSMHFCGRADQWVFDLAEYKNLGAINYGYMPNRYQFSSEYLEYLYNNPRYKKPTLGYMIHEPDFGKIDFNRFSTGISFHIAQPGLDAAQHLLERYMA